MGDLKFSDIVNQILSSTVLQSDDIVRINDESFSISSGPYPINSYDQATIQNSTNKNYKLTELIYKVFYSTGKIKVDAKTVMEQSQAIPELTERTKFMDVLSENNKSRTHYNKHWQILSGDPFNGYKIKKNTEIRHVPESQLHPISNTNLIAPGDMVAVFQTKEDREKQNIFYHCYGDHWIREDKRIVRFYFNINSLKVHVLLKEITERFNRYKLPFCFKCLNHPSLYQFRADTAVLYIQQIDHHMVWSILKEIIKNLEPDLLKETPILTLKIRDGVGFAESPKDYSSFGWNRCSVLAKYVLENSRNTSSSKSKIRDFLANHGISIDEIYLISLSGYQYNFEP